MKIIMIFITFFSLGCSFTPTESTCIVALSTPSSPLTTSQSWLSWWHLILFLLLVKDVYELFFFVNGVDEFTNCMTDNQDPKHQLPALCPPCQVTYICDYLSTMLKKIKINQEFNEHPLPLWIFLETVGPAAWRTLPHRGTCTLCITLTCILTLLKWVHVKLSIPTTHLVLHFACLVDAKHKV